MNLPSRSDPDPEPEITGTEALRRRVWSRWKRANLSRTAMDLSIPISSLEAFAKGEGKLSELHLQALTKEFFMNARYDPIADRLVDISPPATPIIRVVPKPYVPGSSPYTVYPDQNRVLRQRTVDGPEPSQNSFKRPGFA